MTTSMLSRSLAALAALALASPAFAQEFSAAPTTLDVRYADANSDRVILYSTAETHPAGTFYFSDYEIVLLQIGYAFTDNLQVSLTGLPPMFTDQPYFFDVTAKLNVLRTDYFRAALQFAGDAVFSPQSNPSSIFGVRAGGIGQFCFNAACLSSLTLNAGTLLNNKSNEVVPVYLAAGLSIHVTDLIKLMVEPSYAVAVGNGKVDGPSGFILNYGIRLSGKQFGFDLAFVRPIGSDTGGLVMGVPVITFTYRTESSPQRT
jgi:hypothetical protein